MPKIVIMMDGNVIKEVKLSKERTALGRRPYNDIVIEHLAVSGEHAAFLMQYGTVVVEDLKSTNGTFVNGRAVKKQQLQNGDTLEIGKCKIRFESEVEFEKTMLVSPAKMPVAVHAPVPAAPELLGSIKVLTGPAGGREMALTKVVTTVGKPGISIAAITRRPHHFVVHYVEGPDRPLLNGVILSAEPVALKHGDQIELAGTKMQFLQS